MIGEVPPPGKVLSLVVALAVVPEAIGPCSAGLLVRGGMLAGASASRIRSAPFAFYAPWSHRHTLKFLHLGLGDARSKTPESQKFAKTIQNLRNRIPTFGVRG